MSQTKEGTITRVFDPQEGTRRPWNVMLDGDETRYSTFKKEVADVARANIGNRGTVTYTVNEGNGYTNTYFEGFEPMKTLDRELTDRGSNGAAPNYRQPTHPDEKASIHRSVAIQRANEWLPYLENPKLQDVFALADQYVEWLEKK